jgi:polyhydroxybutyrate depolymerase
MTLTRGGEPLTMTKLRVLFSTVLPALVALAGCSSAGSVTGETGSGAASSGPSSSSSATSSASSGGSPDAGPIGGSRPVDVYVPSSYVAGTAVPLVMMLHGYSATAALEETYLDITAQAEARGFIYARPNGTVDASGEQFWNADDACCDLYGVAVDDSTYLSDVITEIEARYTIDPKRVFVMGHSNGGFMAYRMACDHADQIAAIVSLAGAMPTDASACKPSAPVATLEIHGTADTVVLFAGGTIAHVSPPGLVAYPPVSTTVADWVSRNGCSTTPDTSAPNLTLDALALPGATTVTKYATGCAPGGHSELWTMVGSEHIPDLAPAFTPDFIQFFYDHPRP